jgi:hypothetical protein
VPVFARHAVAREDEFETGPNRVLTQRMETVLQPESATLAELRALDAARFDRRHVRG